MKFFNREKEISLLQKIQKQSLENAKFTVITGRRRIGKTQLLLQATKGQPTLYFFVARKSEAFLCKDFIQEVKEKLKIPVLGEASSFGKLFQFLMEYSKHIPFTLIIDEFQEFYHVAPSVYSEMQHHWDINKNESKMNLIVCGSVFSLMHKIFQNSKEPLFGRTTQAIKIRPFETTVLKEILNEHNSLWKPDDLLALYSFTGGVAKYIQLFMDGGAHTKNRMIGFISEEDSPFLQEGKNMLIEEFGKEYATYFSILSAIARGENTRRKMEAIINREVSGYLTKMEKDYSLITKSLPIFSKVSSKNIRYVINDNFLNFWFRFIYKFSHIIEIGNYDELKKIIERDYATFSGKMLERYFYKKLMEEKRFTRIGSYWDRKGETEIDLIAVNERKKYAEIIEVKRNSSQFNMEKLREKSYGFMRATGELSDYKIDYRELSLNDM
ncbi:MAG TPA: ATP-binding protein [Tangfeifania sp.]|nr:ATP-binding protein [Tangfeifania sp.]